MILCCLQKKNSSLEVRSQAKLHDSIPGAGRFQYLAQGHFNSVDDYKHGEFLVKDSRSDHNSSELPLKGRKNTVPSLILALASYLLEPEKIPEPTVACLTVST